MRRIVGAIIGKELREIWRDPLSLSLSLLLPLVLLMLFAYGLNFDIGQVRLGVYDNDRSTSSRDYLASLTASGDLVVWGEAASVADLEAWLDRGSIDAGFNTLALCPWQDMDHLALVDRNTLEQCTRIKEDITINDLISPRVWLLVQKPLD